MIEPTKILASTVMTILMPYITKGGQEFVRLAGDVAYQKAKALLDFLKSTFVDDEEATENLNRLEEKPDRYRPVVEDILNEKLAANTALAAAVEQRLKDLGPDVEIIQKIKVGERVTGLRVDTMVAGKAVVKQDIGTGIDITGADVNRIGG